MNRRDFLISTSAFATAPFARAAAPAVEPIHLGVIGAGSRAQEDMRQFLRVPGVSIQAICDVYPPRSKQVNDLVGHDVPCSPHYQELLSRTDIDAVLIATPIACHAEHVIAAARSGRPIYEEKALGFRVEDNNNILREVKRNKVLFQVGLEASQPSRCKANLGIRAGKHAEPPPSLATRSDTGEGLRKAQPPTGGPKFSQSTNLVLESRILADSSDMSGNASREAKS